MGVVRRKEGFQVSRACLAVMHRHQLRRGRGGTTLYTSREEGVGTRLAAELMLRVHVGMRYADGLILIYIIIM